MLNRLRDESGNVLVIATMMVTLMLVLGGSALSVVDTQSDVTQKERRHESTFNLVEGVLHAQTFVLGRLGAGSGSAPFPPQCTHLSTEALCPTPAQLLRNYDAATQNDFDESVEWWTRVRDNPNGTFYDAATLATAPSYDANQDDRLWVTAEATVRGRTRTLVALIKIEYGEISFPQYAIAGGWFGTSNNGRTRLVDVTGSFGVGVRCDSPPQSPNCLDYNPGQEQLIPPGEFDLNYSTDPAIDAEDLEALEDVARTNGTYFTSCPDDPNGAVVVLAGSGECKINSSSDAAPGMSKCCNSATDPGLLIVKCGSVEFSGNITFYGLVYAPNVNSSGGWCSTGAVIKTQGDARIEGGAIVDGPGGVVVGSSGGNNNNNKPPNLKFNPAAFTGIQTAGTAGVVQNTWREIPDD